MTFASAALAAERQCWADHCGRDTLLEQAIAPVRVILASIAVSVLLGVPVATLLSGLMGGAPLLVWRTTIVGVPVLGWAFMFGSPIAVIFGAMVAILLLAALKRQSWNPRWYGWFAAGAAVGVMVAGLPTGVVLLRMAAHDPQGAVFFEVLGVFIGTGFLCGGVLGLFGWQERLRLGAPAQ